MSEAPYALRRGASWLTMEGEVIPVPSFHDKWLADHPEETQGAHDVAELIQKRRWISVILFDEGYLELLIPERDAQDVRRSIFELLSRNALSWSKATVMAMDGLGYSLLSPSDAADEASLATALSRTI
jgi:hypothetical protein